MTDIYSNVYLAWFKFLGVVELAKVMLVLGTPRRL